MEAKEGEHFKGKSVVSDAARSLSANSGKLHLLDVAVKKLLVMFVGTVAFEFEAKASSDFRSLRNGRNDSRKRKKRKKKKERKMG